MRASRLPEPFQYLLRAFAADQISGHRGLLNILFATLIFIVAAYMLWRSAAAFGSA